MNHELIIAKLETYGFSRDAFLFMRSYLTNRQQRNQVNSNFSTWKDITAGVRQGSILGPLLFNVFVHDLFIFVLNSHLSNYAYDKTLHAFGLNLEEIKSILCFDFELVSKWFEEN